MSYDILVVTWRNLPFVDCLVKSIKRNSVYEHSIYIHFNEAGQEEIEWIDNNKITSTWSQENIGLPQGAEALRPFCKSDTLFLIDDDMICLPDWDKYLEEFRFLNQFNKNFLICPIMVEPISNGSHSISGYYGRNPDEVNYSGLLNSLEDYRKVFKSQYTSWGPFLISKELFDAVGGYSSYTYPAIGSDDDLVKKVWDTGYKDIVSVPKSIVYHFQSTSVSRLDNHQFFSSRRDKIFKEKYGISIEEFHKNKLRRDEIWQKNERK